MDKGNTARILNPFLEGMGSRYRSYIHQEAKISPCMAELHCWLKAPGKCIHNDDMKYLYPKILKADFIIFATPVYFDGMAGPMKMLMDRLMPVFLPSFEIYNGHFRHMVNPEHNPGCKVVLVSTCGLWETDNFHALLSQMRAICRNWGKEFAGALLRPRAEITRLADFPDDITDAAKKAGLQLTQDGKMNNGTLWIVICFFPFH